MNFMHLNKPWSLADRIVVRAFIFACCAAPLMLALL